MLSKDEARSVAERYIAELESVIGTELVLIDEATIERTFGWVFFYNSRSYVDTGNFSECLVGNAPVIITRENGEIHTTGTALPIESYLDNFERFGDPHREPR